MNRPVSKPRLSSFLHLSDILVKEIHEIKAKTQGQKYHTHAKGIVVAYLPRPSK